MADNTDPQILEPVIRPLGGTEYSWCRAVPVGTGITVLGLLLSKPPDIPLLQNTLRNLQNSHPILRSRLRFDPTGNTYSFLTPPTSKLQIETIDLRTTSKIIAGDTHITPFHQTLERELNLNKWNHSGDSPPDDTDLFFASIYTLGDERWAVILRLHTAACDRTAAVTLLRELLWEVGGKGVEREGEVEGEVSLGIEDLIPNGKANKPFWARGVDMLGYSLNSFRLANLDFVDADSPRRSQVVRLQMNTEETQRLVDECKSREIKLCAALAGAALLAVHSSKDLPDYESGKYAIVTLIDCRTLLDPPLGNDHLGFYHSAILNTHDVCRETLWQMAKRCYMSFASAKNSNKHFSDMSDLNFLMCKAIENPGLTTCSSMRTALISVFEDPVIDCSSEIHRELGLEDYVGCSSVHGVGPSIAMFDAIRDGELDCACVYPSPLHSRKQMEELIDHIKRILVDACKIEEQIE